MGEHFEGQYEGGFRKTGSYNLASGDSYEGSFLKDGKTNIMLEPGTEIGELRETTLTFSQQQPEKSSPAKPWEGKPRPGSLQENQKPSETILFKALKVFNSPVIYSCFCSIFKV